MTIEITKPVLGYLQKLKLAELEGGADSLIKAAKLTDDLTQYPVEALRQFRDKTDNPKFKEIFNLAIEYQTGDKTETIQKPKAVFFDIEKIECGSGGNQIKFTVKNMRLNKVFDFYTVEFFLDEAPYENELKRLKQAQDAIEEKPDLFSEETKKKLEEIEQKKIETKKELEQAKAKFSDLNFCFLTNKSEYTARGTRIFFNAPVDRDIIEILKRGIDDFNRKCKCYLIPNHE